VEGRQARMEVGQHEGDFLGKLTPRDN
jgi:hypothetical protein